MIEQGGLPDPRLARHHERPAVTVPDPAYQARQQCHLELSTHQHGRNVKHASTPVQYLIRDFPDTNRMPCHWARSSFPGRTLMIMLIRVPKAEDGQGTRLPLPAARLLMESDACLEQLPAKWKPPRSR
jgi:hypothetical protein